MHHSGSSGTLCVQFGFFYMSICFKEMGRFESNLHLTERQCASMLIYSTTNKESCVHRLAHTLLTQTPLKSEPPLSRVHRVQNMWPIWVQAPETSDSTVIPFN